MLIFATLTRLVGRRHSIDLIPMPKRRSCTERTFSPTTTPPTLYGPPGPRPPLIPSSSYPAICARSIDNLISAALSGSLGDCRALRQRACAGVGMTSRNVFVDLGFVNKQQVPHKRKIDCFHICSASHPKSLLSRFAACLLCVGTRNVRCSP